MTVCCLLGLINIGSSVALNAVVSMAVSGLYLSYLTVGSLLLYRRYTGAISAYQKGAACEAGGVEVVNVPGAKLVWGPFHVPGIWGHAINTYAVVYMVIVVFFSFWPSQMDVDKTTMNFSVVGTGGTVILALLYYGLRARKVYEGPVMEVQM